MSEERIERDFGCAGICSRNRSGIENVSALSVKGSSRALPRDASCQAPNGRADSLLLPFVHRTFVMLAEAHRQLLDRFLAKVIQCADRNEELIR